MVVSPEDRIVVCNRSSRSPGAWPKLLARLLGVSTPPGRAARHKRFGADREYLSTFVLGNARDTPERIGKGLEGKVVYLVSQDSNQFDRQALTMHNLLLAKTAKYNGAARVVLVQPCLWYGAQERGVHDVDHPRMESLDARLKFNGQGPSLRFAAEMYKDAGIDNIVTVHTHSPGDVTRIFSDVFERDDVILDLDMAGLVGAYIAVQQMGGLLDIENEGENLVFMAPDAGAAAFVERVVQASGLTRASALYNLKERLDEMQVEVRQGSVSDNYTGYDGKTVVLCDDLIRTGGTSARNIARLYGNGGETPARVVVYATHSSLAVARNKLDIPQIHDIMVTNTVPTVVQQCGDLDEKLLIFGVAGYVADAITECLEKGVSPVQRYTPEFLRRNVDRLTQGRTLDMHYSKH